MRPILSIIVISLLILSCSSGNLHAATEDIPTVEIGSQTWMSENLNVKHYRNGDPIPHLIALEEHEARITGAYITLQDIFDISLREDEIFQSKIDYMVINPDDIVLYNYLAITDPRGLAPDGFRIPTGEDWNILLYNLFDRFETMPTYRDIERLLIIHPSKYLFGTDTTNESGFSAIPGGLRNSDGSFGRIEKSFWSKIASGIWSLSEDNNPYFLELEQFLNTAILRKTDKNSGYYIRLIKDSDTEDEHGFDTIKIGSQVWTQKNLNIKHYRNQDPIPYIECPQEWADTKEGAWCRSDEGSDDTEEDGIIYNYYVLTDPRGIAPDGWRIPTNEDWKILIDYLGGYETAGGKLKSKSGWREGYRGEDIYENAVGFDAPIFFPGLPSELEQRRYWGKWGEYYYRDRIGSMQRISSRPSPYEIYYRASGIVIPSICSELNVAFLRCVKDVEIERKETIVIGPTEWMNRNLDVTHYRNGDPIPHVECPEEWANLEEGAWCYFLNDPEIGNNYGKIYNGYALLDPRGLAPEGYRIATDKDWKEGHRLKDSSRGIYVLKDNGHWKDGIVTQFYALGARDVSGRFYGGGPMGPVSYFWALMEEDISKLSAIVSFNSLYILDTTHFHVSISRPINSGHYVRVVKDNSNEDDK